MEKRLIARTAVCWLIAAGAAGFLGTANAQITAVAGGTDYLQTAPGTKAMLPYGLGTVTLHGVPIKSSTQKLGAADTEIEHAEGIFQSTGGIGTDTLAGPTVVVPIIVHQLNLAGTVQASSPTTDTCTVHVNLAPTPPSTGLLTLVESSATGGSYTSTLNLHVQITFTPDQAGATCYPPIPNVLCPMMQGQNGTAPGMWSIVPVPGEVLVPGPYGDLAANAHTGMPAGVHDFYITQLQTDSAATAEHATCEAFTALHKTCPKRTTP
jgi:hypothetical protein